MVFEPVRRSVGLRLKKKRLKCLLDIIMKLIVPRNLLIHLSLYTFGRTFVS